MVRRQTSLWYSTRLRWTVETISKWTIKTRMMFRKLTAVRLQRAGGHQSTQFLQETHYCNKKLQQEMQINTSNQQLTNYTSELNENSRATDK